MKGCGKLLLDSGMAKPGKYLKEVKIHTHTPALYNIQEFGGIIKTIITSIIK